MTLVQHWRFCKRWDRILVWFLRGKNEIFCFWGTYLREDQSETSTRKTGNVVRPPRRLPDSWVECWSRDEAAWRRNVKVMPIHLSGRVDIGILRFWSPKTLHVKLGIIWRFLKMLVISWVGELFSWFFGPRYKSVYTASVRNIFPLAARLVGFSQYWTFWPHFESTKKPILI